MAIDIERFQMITAQIQQYWSSPFQVTLALIFLFFTLGISAFSGVVVMVIFIPLTVSGSLFTKVNFMFFFVIFYRNGKWNK